MILTGKSIIRRKIISHCVDEHVQAQPAGIDLTVKAIYMFEAALTIDFNNTKRNKPLYIPT